MPPGRDAPSPPMLDLAAFCLVTTAAFAWLNTRLAALPTTIGVMAAAFVGSALLVVLAHFGQAERIHAFEHALVGAIDFPRVLLQGMLSFLLFAGAMRTRLRALARHGLQVAALSVLSTAASAGVVGGALYAVLPLLGEPLPLSWCLAFGALVSPTDPVAVMGLLRTAGTPKDLEQVVVGESLFNDGVGIVLFLLAVGMLRDGEAPTLAEAGLLLLREAGGGLLLGGVIGWVTWHLVRVIDQHEVEVLITLAVVVGGDALASHLGVSAPLTAVVCGLVVGNQVRSRAMSDDTRLHVDVFWHLVEEILNAVLFVLVGLQVAMLRITGERLLAAGAALVLSLAARWLTAGLPVDAAPGWFRLPPRSGLVLTWGGLRGAISLALALSLPPGPRRDGLLVMAYGVVVFSIVVQGLTLGPLVRRWMGAAAGAPSGGEGR